MPTCIPVSVPRLLDHASSSARGLNWVSNNVPISAEWGAAASSSNGVLLCLGSSRGGVYISRDAGATWSQSSLPKERFPVLLAKSNSATAAARKRGEGSQRPNYARFRVGFDVAASGKGDLAVLYIDRISGDQLRLEGLVTARTEDWHFLKTTLFFFLDELPNVHAAGDETGLGRQICWEAAKQYSRRFLSVNFASEKHDLGFSLMNQLSIGEKVFPRSETDVAADFFALRKAHNGSKWVFSEGRNAYNQVSHCDIAWVGALSTHAHFERHGEVGACVVLENGYTDGKHFYPSGGGCLPAEHAMLWSDDPSIWKRLR